MKIRIGKIGKKGKIAIGIALAWFLLHTFYVIYDGTHSYVGNADIAIVLGNTVNADSSLSPWLKGRVDKALELYRERRVKKIMVSGGKGEYGVEEGDAMRKYLLEKQVWATDIITDNNGNNTYLTARDFISANDSLHFSSVIAVTSFYHMTRTKYILRKMGCKKVYGVSSDAYFWPQDIYGLFREFFAFYKYALVY